MHFPPGKSAAPVTPVPHASVKGPTGGRGEDRHPKGDTNAPRTLTEMRLSKGRHLSLSKQRLCFASDDPAVSGNSAQACGTREGDPLSRQTTVLRDGQRECLKTLSPYCWQPGAQRSWGAFALSFIVSAPNIHTARTASLAAQGRRSRLSQGPSRLVVSNLCGFTLKHRGP